MKHEGSRQVGGFRSIPAPGAPARLVSKAKARKAKHRGPKRQPETRSHNAVFHAELRCLRSALWNNDNPQRIAHLERRIDLIVNEWEPHT
jgi:hypothetical protein